MDDVKNFSDLAETIRSNMKPEIISVDKGSVEKASVLALPSEMTVVSLKKYLDENRPVPERRQGTIKVCRLSSLVEVVNRFKNAASVIYAKAAISDNAIVATIKAYLDYHPASGVVTEAENLGHTVSYNFPVSNQFAIWLKNNKQAKSQAEFSIFLEEHIDEIVTASDAEKAMIEGLKPKWAEPLEMLALSRDLEIYATGKIKNKQRNSSGEMEIQFIEEHKDVAGNAISIPDFFVIRLPLFEDSEPARVIVRLRYRLLGEGKVSWFYDLYRVDLALEASFNNDCAWVKEETSLPLFFGEAEK